MVALTTVTRSLAGLLAALLTLLAPPLSCHAGLLQGLCCVTDTTWQSNMLFCAALQGFSA